MERKVNEPFKDPRGKMVKAVLSNPDGSCCGCCYRGFGINYCLYSCTSNCRSDGKDVVFKEVAE